MHCKKNFKVARDTGNNLLLQVKANQPTVFEAVRAQAGSSTPSDTTVSRDKGRSRQEDRSWNASGWRYANRA